MKTFFLFLQLAMFCVNVSYAKVNYEDPEVGIKSKLSNSGEQVLIQLELPNVAMVGFELADESMKTLHLWRSQTLEEGQNHITLNLPEIQPGKYLLSIIVDDQSFEHLVFIP